MPRRGQQPALVHGTVDWCLPGRRYSGVGYGSAGGLTASGQRVGCHQKLSVETERGREREKYVFFREKKLLLH